MGAVQVICICGHSSAHKHDDGQLGTISLAWICSKHRWSAVTHKSLLGTRWWLSLDLYKKHRKLFVIGALPNFLYFCQSQMRSLCFGAEWEEYMTSGDDEAAVG